MELVVTRNRIGTVGVLACAVCIPINLLFCQATDSQLESVARAARVAESKQDYKGAIDQYRILAGLVPDNPQLRTNLGIALYLNGDSAAALVELQQASELSPDLFAPHLFAGLTWFRLTKADLAEAELSRAIQINNADPVAHLWLGYTYMVQSKYELAVEQLKTALAAQNDNSDALYALGKSYLELGRLAAEQLLKIAPDGGRAWQLAADQCRMRGDLSKALDLYKGAYQRRPDIPELRTVLHSSNITASVPAPASIAGEDDLFRKAREFELLSRESFDQIGRVAPNSYRAHQMLADSYAAQAHNEEAIFEYRVVLRLKPGLPSIHQAIGTQLLQLARVAEAVPEFEAELKIQPQSSEARVDLARAQLLAGDTAKAEKQLLSAARLDHPPAGTFKLLAKIDLERKNYSGAISRLERYVNLVPKDSSAHYLLARAYRAVGNQTASRREIAKYQQLSIDAKNRTAAQRAIEALNRNSQSEVSQSGDKEPEWSEAPKN